MEEYVFVYSKEAINNFYDATAITGVIRVLGSIDAGNELVGDDFNFASMLYNQQGIIGVLKVYEDENRWMHSLDFQNGFFHFEIERLERRKGRVQISFNFDNQKQMTWVAFEVLESRSN